MTVRRAEPTDAGPMARALRVSDLRELSAMGKPDAEQAIVFSVKHCDHAWSGWLGDEPVAIGGIGRIGSMAVPFGMPWMLGTDLLDRYPLETVRKTRRLFERMAAEYPNQYNWVHVENGLSIAWLSWLGYNVRPAKPHGPMGEKFHLFTLGTTYV